MLSFVVFDGNFGNVDIINFGIFIKSFLVIVINIINFVLFFDNN